MRPLNAIAGCSLAFLVNASVFPDIAVADCGTFACKGDLKTPGGDTLGYNFVTTSRIYAGHGVTVYETCVQNLSDRDMEFNWFIPGPHTYVPAGYSCTNPRPKLTHDDISVYDGCLYYGNDWKRSRSSFLPHSDDKSKIDAESKDVKCGTVPVSTKAKASTIYDLTTSALKVGIAETVDVFAPTDSKYPSETMVYLHATITLKLDPDDGHRYLHHITIRASSFNKSSPDFATLKIIPEHTGIDDFYKWIPENGIPLTSNIDVSSNFSIPKSPKLDSIIFNIVDKDNQTMAAMFIPYIIDAN